MATNRNRLKFCDKSFNDRFEIIGLKLVRGRLKTRLRQLGLWKEKELIRKKLNDLMWAQCKANLSKQIVPFVV